MEIYTKIALEAKAICVLLDGQPRDRSHGRNSRGREGQEGVVEGVEPHPQDGREAIVWDGPPGPPQVLYDRLVPVPDLQQEAEELGQFPASSLRSSAL